MDYGIPPSLEGHINGVDIKLIKNTFQANYHYDTSFKNFDQLDILVNNAGINGFENRQDIIDERIKINNLQNKEFSELPLSCSIY